MSFSPSKRNFLKHVLFTALLPVATLATATPQHYQTSKFMKTVIDTINRQHNLRKIFSPTAVARLIAIIDMQPRAKSLPDMQQQIKNDFANGDTLLVQGYIFSYTEIKLCLCYDYLGRGKHVV